MYTQEVVHKTKFYPCIALSDGGATLCINFVYTKYYNTVSRKHARDIRRANTNLKWLHVQEDHPFHTK